MDRDKQCPICDSFDITEVEVEYFQCNECEEFFDIEQAYGER